MSDSNQRFDPTGLPSPEAYRADLKGSKGLSRGGESARVSPGLDSGRGIRWPWVRFSKSREPGNAEVAQGFRRNSLVVGFSWALCMFLLLQVLGIAALRVVTSDPSDEAERLAALIVTLVVDVVALVLVPVLVLGGSRKSLSVLGIRRPSTRAIAWGLAGLCGAYIVLGIYIALVELIGVDDLIPVSTIDEDVIYDHIYLVALTGLLAVIVAPLTEEIFYRGFLLGGIAHRLGTPVALVLSSTIFAAVHADVGSLIPFALIGIIFALIYVRSGNLFSAVLAHFLFNVIAFVATVADRSIG